MAGFYKSFFKVSMIFCVVWALSFNAFGEQEGFCVDCVKGGEVHGELLNLRKLTCEAQFNRPECKNVPKIMRPDCDSTEKKNGVMNVVMDAVKTVAPTMACVTAGVSGMATAGFTAFSILGKGTAVKGIGTKRPLLVSSVPYLRAVPWVAGAALGGAGLYFAVQYDNFVKKVLTEAPQRGLDPKDSKSIRTAARQEFSLHYGKKIYNLLHGDSHCYNEVIQSVRVCGMLSALAGGAAVAGGVSMGLVGHAITGSAGGTLLGASAGLVTGASVGGIPTRLLSREYEKAHADISKRIQDVKDDAPPSATETVDTLLNEASQ